MHIHTPRRFNNHTTHSFYRILVTETSAVKVMEMGNIAPRVGIEPISLAFQASVLSIPPSRLPDVITDLSMQLLHYLADYYIYI